MEGCTTNTSLEKVSYHVKSCWLGARSTTVLRKAFCRRRLTGLSSSSLCLLVQMFAFSDAKGLMNADRTEACREKLYTGLEEHCHQMHPQDVSRFAKILLRLPSLRSISLKCPDLLFFSQLFPQLPVDGFLSRLLQQPTRDLRSISVDVETEEFQRKMLLPPAGVGANGNQSLNMMGQVSEFLQSSFGNHAGASNGSPWNGNNARPPSADSMFSYPGGLIKQEPSNSFS